MDLVVATMLEATDIEEDYHRIGVHDAGAGNIKLICLQQNQEHKREEETMGDRFSSVCLPGVISWLEAVGFGLAG